MSSFYQLIKRAHLVVAVFWLLFYAGLLIAKLTDEVQPKTSNIIFLVLFILLLLLGIGATLKENRLLLTAHGFVLLTSVAAAVIFGLDTFTLAGLFVVLYMVLFAWTQAELIRRGMNLYH